MPDGRSASPEAPVAPTNTAEGSKGPGFSAAPTKDSSPTRTPFEAAPTGEPKETGDIKPKPETKTKKTEGKEPEEPKKPAEPVEEPKKPEYEAAEADVRKDEKGRFIATAGNAQANLEKRIRKEAQDQIREAQREGSAWNPLHWARKLKFKFGEDYYTQRGVQMLRQAAIDNNNVFVDMDIIHNSVRQANVRDADRGRAEHKSESRAKLEQIALGQQIEDDTSFQNVKEAEGRLKDLMIQEVFKPIVEGDVTTHAEVQKKLRDFVERHENDADESVRNQINEMFGRSATDFQERAQIFATDFLEVGQAIAADKEAHGYAIDQIGEKIRIDLANTEWASSTQVQFSRADRLATRLKSTKAGPWLNEATIGAAVSLGTFFAYKGAGRALSAAGAGAGAGFLIGAVERNRNLKKDIAAHRARTEYGQNVDTTAREGTHGKLLDRFDTSKQMERFRYQEIASVDAMLNSDNERSVLGGDARSLNTLLNLDLSGTNTANREALARRVAEIQERLHYSAETGAGMIQFEGEQLTEQGRLELVKGIAEGRQALEQALIDSGTSQEDAKAEVADMLRKSRAQWEQRFTTDVRDQDNAFKKYRIKSSLAHGAFGGVVGFGSSVVSQQIIAEIGAHTFDSKPVEDTLLEEVGIEPDEIAESAGIDLESHSGANSGAINDLEEALENNQPNDVVASFGELGLQVHTENNQIIIDAVNGQPIDAAVPPTLTYDPESSTFSFQGELPPEAKQVLDDNHFNISEGNNPSEAVRANPQPELQTIPGTNMQVEIPLGTYLREGADGTYDLYTKDLTNPTDISPVTDARGFQLPNGSLEGGGGTKIAEGIRFDATGHMIAGEITRPDIIQLGEPRPGPDTAIETNRWVEENSANAQVEQWYGNNSEVSDNNELKLYDRRVGPEAVQFDMMSMEESWQNGNFPPNVDVPQVIQEDRAVFTFWDKNNPDQPIIVRAEHGQVTLDKNSQDMVEVWKTKPDGTEGWVEVKNSEVAQAVLGDLGDFEEASDIGHTEILNYNVSAGDIQVQQNGEPLVSSYATAQGTGTPPETIGHPSEITTFQAVQTTEIEFPESWEAPPIATPITPRRHLNESEPPPPGKEVPIKEPPTPILYNSVEGGAIEPRVRAWLDEHKSETLKANPQAELNPYQEAHKYFDKQDPAYRAEIATLAEQLPPPSDKLKAIIAIPVAGHQEGNQIYETLKNYLNQTASNDTFEVQLFVNRPETDLNGNPTSSQETLDAIARFQAEHPNFPLRVVEKVFPPNEANIGRIRKYGADLALYRHMQRGPDAGDIIILSNDADNKGVVPRYVQTFIDRYEANPHAEAMLGQLDWDPEAYAQYPVVHIGTRLFQYLNIIGRHRSGRMVSSGANSSFKGSAYAAIGGYVTNLEGGEDIAIGKAIIAARGDDHTRLAHATPARLYTSSRRAVDALQKGLPPLDQWNQGFSAFDDEVRRLELGQESTIDYDKPEEVAKLKEGLEWVINTTIDHYEAGEQLGKNSEFYANALRYLGIRYSVIDGQIAITNMDTVARNLKHYREIAVLQRDIISGKGGQAAKDRLSQLKAEFALETNPPVTPEGIPAEPIEIPEIDERLDNFNATETIQLPDVPAPKFTLQDLEASKRKHEVGDFVLCEDKFLDREGNNNIVAGYNKNTGQLVAFKISDGSDVDEATLNEEFIKNNVDNPIFFTYESTMSDGDRTLRAYPIISTDLLGYLDKHGTLTDQQALGIMIQLTQGLRELHQHGRGHFDFASSNIFIDADGKVHLADFDALVSRDQLRTDPNLAAGNVYIKPPELYENNPESIEAVDTYEAAVLLYQTLVGETPYHHLGRVDGESEEARRQRYYAAKKAENYSIPDNIPASIKAIIQRGLNHDPELRYQSMDQMLNDLLDAYIQVRAPQTTATPESTGGPPSPPEPPAPTTPSESTTGRETARPTRIELSSAATLRDEINETIRNGTETEYAFTLTPEMLAEYIRNNPQLFGDRIGINSLDANIVDGRLEVNGNFVFDGTTEVGLNNATFTFTPDGHLVLEGIPDLNLENLNMAQRALARRLIRNRMNNVDERVRTAINEHLEDDNWGVAGFSELDGTIAIQLQNDPDLHIVHASHTDTAPDEERRTRRRMRRTRRETAPPAEPEQTPEEEETPSRPEQPPAETVTPETTVNPEPETEHVESQVGADAVTEHIRTQEPAEETEPATDTMTRPLPIETERTERTATLPITELSSSESFNDQLVETLNAERDVEHMFSVDPAVLSEYLYEETRDPNSFFGNSIRFGPPPGENPSPNERRLTIALDGNTLVVSGDFTVNGQYNMRLEEARFGLDDYGQFVSTGEMALNGLGTVNPNYATGETDLSNIIAHHTIEEFNRNLISLIDDKILQRRNNTWGVEGFQIIGNRLGIITGRRLQRQRAA